MCPDCPEVNVVFVMNCCGDMLAGRNYAGDVVPFEFNSGRTEGNRKTNLVDW